LPGAHIKKLTTADFTLLCKLVAQHKLPLMKFMEVGRSYAADNINEFTFQELGDVLLTFLMAMEDISLAQKAEERVLKHGRKMSVDDCISLMNAFMLYNSSEDLWLLFDVVIGKNIRKVEDSQIIPILHMFSKAPHKREKIFEVFVHKIEKAKFDITDNCAIARIYGEFEYSKQDMFDILDQRLSNRIFEMSDEDVTNALIGFLNPNIKRNTAILENLELHIQEIMSKISLQNSITLLLRYGKLKTGTKTMVESCMNHIYQIVKKTEPTSNKVNYMQLLMILYAYNLSGADRSLYVPLIPHLTYNVEMYDLDRLNEIYNLLLRFKDDDDTFSEVIVAYRYELEKFNENGTKKSSI
jgi:hypothetical protein